MRKTARSPDELIRITKGLFGTNRPHQGRLYSQTDITEWEVRKQFGSFGGLMETMGWSRFESKTIPIDLEAKLNIRINKLEADNRKLSGLLDETEKQVLTDERLKTLIGSINGVETNVTPDWVKIQKNTGKNFGIPVLFCSDWHLDENVKPEQINHCNAFNRDIAVKRIKLLYARTIELLKYHLADPKFDGIINPFGGDIFSGFIHEELAETNEDVIFSSIMFYAEIIANCILKLEQEFGNVLVPWVVGNHGRLHKKPRYKDSVKNNFEWLLAQILIRELKHRKNIQFMVPESKDCMFDIYGLKVMMTHGDQFKGGTGIAGLFSPLMLGMARKQKRQQAIGQPFDLIMMGHFHQYIHAQNLIVNGSLKGYDEFAFNLNLPYEPPQQSLFVVRGDKKITFRMPVFCD